MTRRNWLLSPAAGAHGFSEPKPAIETGAVARSDGAGIPFVERDLQLYDALAADEVFITATPYCIAPVTRINGAPIGGGRPCGPMFERLLAPWNTEIGLDIRQQILGAT